MSRTTGFRILYLALVGIFSSQALLALEADLVLTRYRTPDQAYAEFFIYVLGNSVQSQRKDSLNYARVDVTYFIQSGDQLITGDKYRLVSSGGENIDDFMDLRRHILPPGNYDISVELKDVLDSTNTITLTKSFIITTYRDELAQSDILLLASLEASVEDNVWVRQGKRMTPLPYSWYHPDMDNLYFYKELYYSDIQLAGDFYITYSIAPERDPNNILLKGHKRLKPQPVNTVLQVIDIQGLSSGAYILTLEVFDQNKQLLLNSRKSFLRDNPDVDVQVEYLGGRLYEKSFVNAIPEDSLEYILKAHAAVVPQTQVSVLNYLIEKGDIETQKRFIHRYWLTVAQDDPEAGFDKYMALARMVDQEYHAAFGRGFETDRGRIMLKYGAPNDVVSISDEPSAPPYEIWIYHNFPITGQNNVRFLFYNPSLAGGAYELLHSTARGEINNNRWQQMLYRDALSEPGPGDFIDAAGVSDNVNRRAVEYFEHY